MRFTRNLLIGVVPFAILITSGTAQEVKKFAGDYLAVSGPIHVNLHLAQTGDSLGGTVDSPDFRIAGLPVSDVRVSGQSLSFSVPTIKAAWAGFLSEDGNSLSGTWNQGKSVALNFTRTGSSQSQPPATVPSSSPQPPPDSACPAGSMANYWDGSSWKPMAMAVESGKKMKRDASLRRSLNPLNPMGDVANVIMFEGTSAPITLGQSPRFCFPVTPNTRGDYLIGILTVKKNDREVEKFITDRNSPGGNLLFPADKTLGTNSKPLSDRFVEVTPKEPLKEGQYVVANGMMMFDFGVK